MPPKLTKWNVIDHLKTEEDIIAYVNACLVEGDAALVTTALVNVVRARCMISPSQETGISVEDVLELLAGDESPKFSTVLQVVRALGFTLHATRT